MTENPQNLPVVSGPTAQQLVPPRTLPAVSAEFQSDAIEIESRPPPRIARLTLYGVTALIVSAIAWASLSRVDEIVTAQGKLVTTDPTIIVQPLETSIIRSIDVSSGDIVTKGQTLATLDATFSQADVNQKRSQYAALDTQVQRLEAELSGTDYTLAPGHTAEQALQAQLFGQRRAFYVAQLQNFDQQIAGQIAALTSSRDEELVLRERRENLGLIEDARKKLYERQTGSLLNLLGSRDARLEVDASLARVTGDATVASHTLAKLRADRQAFIEDFRRATVEQLVELRGERDAVKEDVTKMELRRTMVALTAPADAIVLDLAQRSIGSIVREAEPLLTLVPLGVPLEAEVSIDTRDIGRLSTGEAARIKLDAFPFQKFGTAAGRIRTISPDAIQQPRGEQAEGPAAAPVYKARIALQTDGLRQDGAQAIQLLPGMTVTAEIQVDSRTVISYFLYPLIRGLDESLREP
jgi:HlyD family secretion protein